MNVLLAPDVAYLNSVETLMGRFNAIVGLVSHVMLMVLASMKMNVFWLQIIAQLIPYV